MCHAHACSFTAGSMCGTYFAALLLRSEGACELLHEVMLFKERGDYNSTHRFGECVTVNTPVLPGTVHCS